jgi:GT2 family glycosyltransferase
VTPRFSVIVPAFQAERTLASSLRSVLQQTCGDFELIVVDDGSTDGTAAVAEAFLEDPRVRLLRQENRGLAGARNAGIAAARGRYVSFLDSDDLYLPTYLEAYGAALEAEPRAAFAYGDSWALEDGTGKLRRRTAFARMRPPVPPPVDRLEFMRALLERNFICVMATVRTDVLQAAGGHNPGFRQAEDYELWLRLLALGHTPVHVPGLHSIVRDRAGSLKKSESPMLESLAEVYRLVAEEYPDVPDDIRAAARHRRDATLRRAASAGQRRPALHGVRAARRVAGRAKRRFLARTHYLDPPPDEVAAAFPDLAAL